ncbi:MAG: FKBP-type peptidyl-prolyl cis-trans isomerase [bacterium]|nr:FKBP-type peptidyl-prolyl cis-trans isomerase [bacterium]
MKPTHTSIAVALAVVVVAIIFIFPGLSPFPSASAPAAVDAGLTTTDNQSAPTAMSPDSLQLTDKVIGTGVVAETGDTVTVGYVGSFTNGTVFDASANHGSDGFSFVLGAGHVIKGWDEGVVGMKVGGKRMLVVPPMFGYGSQDYGPIPANSTLVFEVELLKVQKAGQ